MGGELSKLYDRINRPKCEGVDKRLCLTSNHRVHAGKESSQDNSMVEIEKVMEMSEFGGRSKK